MADEVHPLSWVDYTMFIAMLLAAMVTGFYQGFKGRQKTTQQFLLADRGVFSLPVAMTLLVSFVSPITLLGTPSEIYHNGSQFSVFIFSAILLYPAMAWIFVPVFHGLKITTAYEYLQKRFGLSLRLFGAVVFIIQTTVYMAIVTFTPALAIEAVTQFPMWIIILLTGVICTLYTAMGGLKAVIYTDMLMFFVIAASMFLVIVLGTIRAGGLSYVFYVNSEYDMLQIFNFPFNPAVRMTFLNVLIGGALNNLSIWAVSQTAVQRFLAAKDLKTAKTSVWMNLPFSAVLVIICCLEGLIMFAFYHGDMLEAEKSLVSAAPGVTLGSDVTYLPEEMYRMPPNLTSKDQILVYFVSSQFGNIPGFQGLFIACIMAGALSTISSGLNALVSVLLVDIIRPFRQWMKDQFDVNLQRGDSWDTIFSKVMTIVLGVFTLLMAFAAPYLGTLLQLTNSVFGAAGGPLVGVFLTGMIWKRANELGTLIGAIFGFIMGLWVSMGAAANKDNIDDAFALYKLSFMWYSGFTLLITFSLSVVVSELFRLIYPDQAAGEVDPALLIPWLRPKSSYEGVAMEEAKQQAKENGKKDSNGYTAVSVSATVS